MSQPRNWEEAFDQLADENHKLRNDKNALWGALDNLTSLWEFAASDRAIEASVKAAREILNRTTPPAAQSQDSGIETVAAQGGLLPQQEPVAKKPCPACGGPLVECQHCEGEGYEPGTDNDVTGPALCRECGGLGGKRNTTPPEAMSTKNRTNREIRELSKTKK